MKCRSSVWLALLVLSLFTSAANAQGVRFAVIGDYGFAGSNEAAVANLVNTWSVDFIITSGDNNYPDGAQSTIDPNIGQYYSNYIFPYFGSYGSTATTNNFYPSLGNHDWISLSCVATACSGPYFDYFTLPSGPGAERYYEFTRGDVAFFAVDSDTREPDGATSTSVQAQWLQSRLAASTSAWKIVFFHHAPYSSSNVHGSQPRMQWPFAQWGADAVIAGHDHTYERIHRDGIVYFVNGLGGRSIYGFGQPIAGSQVRYDGTYGAMRVDATATSIQFQFINIDGTVIDSYTLPTTPASAVHVASIATGSTGVGKGQKKGTANVVVRDNLGVAVQGATVTGTFSGDLGGEASATTDATGTATLETPGSKSGKVTVQFCVSDVSASLPYDPAQNGDPTYACAEGPAPSSVHVAYVETGTTSAGGGHKAGRAIVTIVDDRGQPASGYTVSGNFSGSFDEAVSGDTDVSGAVTLQTTQLNKGKTDVFFCVSNVSGTLVYQPGDNAPGTTCTSQQAKFVSAVPPHPESVLRMYLGRPYPNPFASNSTVEFGVSESGFVRMKLFNILGREVANLFEGKANAGIHEVTIESSGLPTGIYLVHMETLSGRHTRQVALIR